MLLAVHGLGVQRGERVLQRDLAFEVHASDLLWLRGRNGCGKTSLLRLLAGLARPDAGRIEGAAERLYLGHANALNGDLLAIEALDFLARLQGRRHDESTLKTALQQLGVGNRARQPVRTLSQGQRRRVALARLALPSGARVWLLDEPYDALDDQGVAILDALITSHTAAGGAVVLTSHQVLAPRTPPPRELDLGR